MLKWSAVALAIAIGVPVWAFCNVQVAFPPMVGDDHGRTAINAPVEMNLVANDADPDGQLNLSSLTIIDPPQSGQAAVNPRTGMCIYTPKRDFAGKDRFSYQIRDDEGVISNVGLVTVRVERR